MSKKIFKKILPIAAAVAGNAILPGIGGSIGAGLGTLATGGGVKNALLSGVGSAIGGNLGAGAFGGANIGSTLGSAGLGDLGAALGANISNIGIGAALGGYAGSDIAQGLFGSSNAGKSTSAIPAAPPGLTPFTPKREEERAPPASLQGFSSLTPEQQSSGLANQGVYGSGVGPEESTYYLNMINRRLVDDSGKVSENANLSPIELSFLNKLGLGGYGSTSSLLEGISKWRPA